MTCSGASGVGWKVREVVQTVGQKEVEGIGGVMETLDGAITTL